MKKILWNLGEKKACQKSDILLAIIKENIDAFYKNVFLKHRSLSIRVEFPNEILSFSQFPPYMKFEEVFKKEDSNLESNYAPIRILSKLFEKIIPD